MTTDETKITLIVQPLSGSHVIKGQPLTAPEREIRDRLFGRKPQGGQANG